MVQIRDAKTAISVTAVQIVREANRRIVLDVHVGSVRNDVELRVLFNKAYDLLYADQLVLDFDLSVAQDIEQPMTARVLQDVFCFCVVAAWV